MATSTRKSKSPVGDEVGDLAEAIGQFLELLGNPDGESRGEITGFLDDVCQAHTDAGLDRALGQLLLTARIVRVVDRDDDGPAVERYRSAQPRD